MTPYFYRSNLFPSTTVPFRCTVSAPPVPPTAVQNTSILNPFSSVEGSDTRYDFTLLWEPPEFSNGELQEYQIRVIDPEVSDGSSVLLRRGITVRLVAPNSRTSE